MSALFKFEILPLPESTISHGKTQEKYQRGQQKIGQLELDAPFKPIGVAYSRKPKAYEKGGVGWVEGIGKSVAESKCKNAKLT